MVQNPQKLQTELDKWNEDWLMKKKTKTHLKHPKIYEFEFGEISKP